MDSLDLTDLINQTECELNVEIDYTNFDIKSLTVDDFILGVERLLFIDIIYLICLNLFYLKNNFRKVLNTIK